MLSSVRAWIQASRPLAQANIAPPLLFGSALAYARHGSFDRQMLFWTLAFGVVDQLFILFVNDWADQESDRHNTTFNSFSGGSRVLAEGKLSRSQLGRGALLALVLVLGLAGHVAYHHDRWWLPVFALAGVLLVVGYSLPPLKAAYRGHGEWLQALGVGTILPVVGYYLQSGRLDAPWQLLLPCLMIAFAGNITTGLPDHPSDAATNKRSHAVRLGQRRARADSMLLLGLAALLMASMLGELDPASQLMVVGAGVAPLLYSLIWSSRANAENHQACLHFVLGNGASMTLLWLVPASLLWLGT